MLVIALSIQLYFQPFELIALNLLEIESLACLLSTQLSGVLMWYKELPGKNDNAAVYRSATTVLLFATNGLVIASFVLVTAWYYLKQKSKLIVQWLPFTFPFFNALVRAEETLRSPNGNSLLESELADIREDWSFFAALREGVLFGRGAGHAARKRAEKTAAKLARAVNGVFSPEARDRSADGAENTGAENTGASTRTARGGEAAHGAAVRNALTATRPPLAPLGLMHAIGRLPPLTPSSDTPVAAGSAVPAGAALMAHHIQMNPAWGNADDGSAAAGGATAVTLAL